MFVHKYAPKCPDDITFHKKELKILKKMSDDNSVPHIVFCGPKGAGKQTLIKMFMEILYDKDVNILSDVIYKVSGSSNTVTDVIIKQSNYHIVIEPNNNNFDRYLIQDVIKNYAQKMPLNIFTSKKTFKTVLINNIDNLSYYAQTSLRRTMEKYSRTCRFIMWCESLSRVIEPIRSRCYSFIISAPKGTEMLELLLEISYKESIDMDLEKYNTIIKIANGNIRKALFLLQYLKIGMNYDRSYEESISVIITWFLSDDIRAILVIRKMIYGLLTTNISGSQILKDIVLGLFKCEKINDICKMKISEIAAVFEHRLIIGRREIDNIEPFVAEAIYILGKYNK